MSSLPTTSTLICALSGQILQDDEAVVTPSGRICSKALILTKMSENGGTDPFTMQPLDESQLIALHGDMMIPPRPSATSMPSLLKLFNTEYSNLVLELFDTRKLLEDTRKELSHSLYQNDAAVRVIARLSMERDAARQDLMRFKAEPSTFVHEAITPESENAEDMPQAKRVKLDEMEDLPTKNIPLEHVEIMTNTWQQLSQTRKAEKKQVAAKAPTVQDLETFQEVDKKSYHKASGKQGIVSMASSSSGFIVTAGKDKQICVFDGEKVLYSHSLGECKLVDAMYELVGAATTDEKIILFQEEEKLLTLSLEKEIISIQLHPSKQHFVATTKKDIRVYSIDGILLALFVSSSKGEISSAALHPDGLLLAVGTNKGELCLWDFKSQQLASTLSNNDAPIIGIYFSNSGYHVATISDKLLIWDLKKQAILQHLANDVTSAAFDPSGKYIAYSTSSSLVVASVKEGKSLCTIHADGIVHLLWDNVNVVAASDKERAIRLYSSQKALEVE
jgi:pre-mRNA-processing factor 19